MDDEDSARPSIGFPLGVALLFITLLSMSGFFVCCLHWDKLRSLLGRSSDEDEDDHILEIEYTPPTVKKKQNGGQSLPVLMPGDTVPKFIAMACPCEPLRLENIRVEVQKHPN
ncbi:hypothetical protein K2173_027548 [Erythroxylum novogranatense]|uniref:Hydroxyproline-rich glycoprotein family protein n=1 Tax=Erythroxylum novogranatense TaxID=1862640 RepID=A0AAV8TZF1_9ROSI|nr:hypothetical protein K2173_027548 [Erythroxylum novogranatense]